MGFDSREQRRHSLIGLRPKRAVRNDLPPPRQRPRWFKGVVQRRVDGASQQRDSDVTGCQQHHDLVQSIGREGGESREQETIACKGNVALNVVVCLDVVMNPNLGILEVDVNRNKHEASSPSPYILFLNS